MAGAAVAPSESNFSHMLAKLQRARKTKAAFTKKEQGIDDQLKKLQTQMEGLETTRKLSHGQYNEWVSDLYGRTILPYSKAWNLKFAEEMQDRLPRELRDMIYDHLWDLKTRLAPDLYEIIRGQCIPAKAQLLHLYDHHGLPHYLSANYVGPRTALEVTQALYKVSGAALIVLSPSCINDLLFNDGFQVGLKPVTVLRDITVYCKLDDYRVPPVRHVQTPSCQHTIAETAYLKRAQLKSQFEGLLSVKKKKNFNLRIILVQRNIRLAVLAEAMDALRGLCRTFIAEGGRVNIAWTYSGYWQDGPSPDNEIVPKPINQLFHMDREEWEGKMMNYIEGARFIEPRHFRIYDEPSHDENNINVIVHGMWCESESEDSTDDEDDSGEEDFDGDSDEGPEDDH